MHHSKSLVCCPSICTHGICVPVAKVDILLSAESYAYRFRPKISFHFDITTNERDTTHLVRDRPHNA